MSNNKQSSVDWLVEEINKKKAWADPSMLGPIIKQAKAMHKEEIENAWLDGLSKDELQKLSATKYYQQTYGE